MTIDEAIEYWEQFNAEIDDLYDACSDADRDVLVKQREIVEYTISALRQQELFCEVTKKVEPLTLDELREMDGEPVWTVTTGISSSGRWELCTCETVRACPLHKVLRCVTAYGEVTDYDLDTYGKTWLAYRQKPEEGTV